MAKLKKPKFLSGGKKKAAKQKGESPLMADDAKSSASTASSPRLEMEKEKDEEREARKKERDERNRQREQRLADSQASKEPKKGKGKGKGKKKPKLSQEEQDAKDAKLGCCHHCQKILVKLVHVIDAAIGLTFLIYGVLIHTFEDPALEASISSIAFGATMLFTSVMGAVGFFTRFCWRFGLILSAYTAPFIAFFYIFVIIALAESGDIYFNYLNEHKDVMYLDDNEIAVVKRILPFFYIALAPLALIEVIRFMVLRKLHAELVRSDSASQRISARERSERSGRSDLSVPLIGDDRV